MRCVPWCRAALSRAPTPTCMRIRLIITYTLHFSLSRFAATRLVRRGRRCGVASAAVVHRRADLFHLASSHPIPHQAVHHWNERANASQRRERTSHGPYGSKPTTTQGQAAGFGPSPGYQAAVMGRSAKPLYNELKGLGGKGSGCPPPPATVHGFGRSSGARKSKPSGRESIQPERGRMVFGLDL